MNESSVAASPRAQKNARAARAVEYVSSLLSKREYAAVLVLFALLVSVVTVLKTCEVRQQRGDSAIFFQVGENIAHRGLAVSQVFANTQAYLDSGLLTANADQIAADPLAPPIERERNMLRFHAYYILYALAPLMLLFPSNVVLLFLHVLSYAGLLLLAYVVLRRQHVPVMGAVLFCALVISHPAWSEALLYGQFYPDNLFVLAGFALMCLASRQNTSKAALLASAAVCMLVGERAAVTAGIFLIAYALLYWKQQSAESRLLKLGTGAALLIYGMVLIKFVLANSEYGGFLPKNMHVLLAEFSQPAFLEKTALFILVGAPFLLLAAFNFRAAVIALLMIAPNVFGNIGGAEKVGWGTHYHVYYLPGLVWAAMIGYETAYRKISPRIAVQWVYAGAALLVVFLNVISPSSFSPIQFSGANAAGNFFVRLTQEAAADASPAGIQALSQANGVRNAIPEGSTVSTTEEGMPILYHGRTIRFFPMGVDRADYAVMHFRRNGPGDIQFSGAVDFLGPAEVAKINGVLIQRMKRDGYNFKDAQLFPAAGVSGIAVVKRAP